MLEDHLKSDDFFNTRQFPISILTITKAEKVDGTKRQKKAY